MNIEIDYEIAAELAGSVIMQDYKALLENDYYEGDKEKLLEAYRLVMDYCTTETQRVQHGL